MKVKGVGVKLAVALVACSAWNVTAGNEWVRVTSPGVSYGTPHRGQIILASGTPDLQIEERLAPGTGLARPGTDLLDSTITPSDTPSRPATTSRPRTAIPTAPEPTLAPALPKNTPVPMPMDGLDVVNSVDNVSDDGGEIVFDESWGGFDGEIVWDNACYDGWNTCQRDPSLWDLRWGRCGYLSLNLGTTGFTNALDLGANGNFGVSEGLNFSIPISPQGFISWQVGFRGVQTNLTGTAFGSGHRNQTYTTAGIFLRNDMSRFQAGVVYDWLQDDFHRDINLGQLRTEISFRTRGQYEFGFLGTHDVSGEVNAPLTTIDANIIDMNVRPLDCYSLFIRKNMVFGGIGTISGGSTQQGGGLFGAKYEIPLNDRFYISSQMAMYIPKEGQGGGGKEKETWGIGIDLVWSFRGGVMSRQRQMSRPMFDVADATTFFTAVRMK